MIQATQLSKTVIVRRFIDNIILISEDKIVSHEKIENLKSTFKECNLSLTSDITMSIENTITTFPFLDVEHVMTREKENSFFYTRNFTKETAINSTIMYGKSFLSLNIFKAIIT